MQAFLIRPALAAFVGGLFLAGSAMAAPIDLPADLDFGTGKFNPTASGSGFTVSLDSGGNISSTVNANAHVFTASATSNNSRSAFSYAQFDFNAAADPGFEYSATFTITAPTAGNNFNRIELAALGSAAPVIGNPTTMSNALFLNYRQSENTLILSNGGALGTATSALASAQNTTAFNYANPIQMTLSGTFSGANLIINAQASQGSNTVALSHTLVNYTNSFGNYFGYGGRATHNGVLSFDRISINVVPEPAALGVAGLTGLMLLRRRRV